MRDGIVSDDQGFHPRHVGRHFVFGQDAGTGIRNDFIARLLENSFMFAVEI